MREGARVQARGEHHAVPGEREDLPREGRPHLNALAARWSVALGLAFVAACGSSSPSNPGAGGDGGSPATGDSGGGDAGGDAASLGPPIAPSSACGDAIADAYVTPPGLPAMTDAARGDVVRCAPDEAIDAATMGSRMTSAGISGVTAASGAHAWRVAYRTRRGDGSGAISSARVYLPDASRSPMPVIVAAHGTAGLADVCAPSKYTIDDYLILPWVAHGYAVIAPDYAGLGTDGVPGYLETVDTGQSTLDAARALRKLVAAGTFDAKVIVLGHSEGGGAALSAQVLARTYGDGDVAAVIAFAPGWPIGVDVSGYRDPSAATNTGGGALAAFSAMQIAAYFANHAGPSHEGDGFAAGARATIVGDLDSQCIGQLPATIPQAAPTVGDLIDGTFRQTILDCYDGKPTCAEPGKSYVQFLGANVQHADPAGAKVLVVQGLSDVIAPPSLAACIVKDLGADGVTPQVCTDAQAQHLDVVQRQAGFTLSWIDALMAGATPPTCSGAGLPACP